MSNQGSIGDKVGYVVLRQVGMTWAKTPSITFSTIGQAVQKVDHFQWRWPETTFAVAKLELVMISRPDAKP